MSPISSAGHVAHTAKPRLTISGLGHEHRNRPNHHKEQEQNHEINRTQTEYADR